MKYCILAFRLLAVTIIGVFILLTVTPFKLFPMMWQDTIDKFNRDFEQTKL